MSEHRMWIYCVITANLHRQREKKATHFIQNCTAPALRVCIIIIPHLTTSTKQSLWKSNRCSDNHKFSSFYRTRVSINSSLPFKPVLSQMKTVHSIMSQMKTVHSATCEPAEDSPKHNTWANWRQFTLQHLNQMKTVHSVTLEPTEDHPQCNTWAKWTQSTA